jgi:hypothetical protein
VRRLRRSGGFSAAANAVQTHISQDLGAPLWEADRIIVTHIRIYSTYWAWAEAQLKQAFVPNREKMSRILLPCHPLPRNRSDKECPSHVFSEFAALDALSGGSR